MTLDERIASLSQLGKYLREEKDEFLEALQIRTEHHNGWFTLKNQRDALNAIVTEFLDPDKLHAWLQPYIGYFEVKAATHGRYKRTLGLVLAGNIPLVGIHDILCVYVAGHRSQIKLSDKDKFVLPYLLQLLERFDDRNKAYFEVVDKLSDFDAVIATGSNNSARYFESYFGKYPHIIRRNRNGIGVLNGSETKEDLEALGKDVFQFFGLGCRNVAKLFVPRDYDFTLLLEVLHEWNELQNHTKYKNNFDYNYALLTLNKVPFRHTGSIILREDPALLSHIAGLYYEYYDSLEAVEDTIVHRADEIQLVVARPEALRIETKNFGEAQRPGLGDYADGVDTMAFLLSLS